MRREALAARQRQREMQVGMVLQIAPDAAPIGDRHDAETLQFVGRPDADA
jgi:hypothetical protein